MRRAYIFSYGPDFGTRSTVTDLVDDLESVLNWRYELPNTFLFISELTAHDLASEIRRRHGDKGRFLVSEVRENKQGWLFPEAWKLLIEKHDP